MRNSDPCALFLKEPEGVYQNSTKPRLLDQVRQAIRTVQELLGHRDVKTTMIYTHVLNRGGDVR